jgi:uncharacterized protein
MNRYERVKEYILEKHKSGLSPQLFYHSVEHVLDVLNAAEYIGSMEGMNDQEMELIRVAVLFHDVGFTKSHRDHEKAGCLIAENMLPDFGYSSDEIEMIIKMIMSTCIPQTPGNKSEEIICDADLDYLGRDDFFFIAEKLKREMEFTHKKTSEDEWNRIQKEFLEQHHYFTATSQKMRNNKKAAHLAEIKKRIPADE